MIDARFTEHDLQTRLSTANHMTASFEFEIRKSLVTSHKFQSEAEALYRKDIDTAYPVGQLDAMYDDLIASMKGRGCFRSWTGRQSFLERWRAYSEKMLAIWLEWVDFLEEAKFLEMVRMVLDDLWVWRWSLRRRLSWLTYRFF